MKRVISLCLAIGIATALAAGGVTQDNLAIKSDVLGVEKKYAIYLPEGYQTSGKSYPVLYLLHGAGGNQSAWIRNGKVKAIADKAVEEGKAVEMIIVMPDAGAPRQGYFNGIKGEWRYEDYFFGELIPHIEKTYRCLADRDHRAIAGLSMGGGGTLYYALHHPEMFAAACPLSPYAALDKELIFSRFTEAGYLKGVTREEFDAYYRRHNLTDIINNADAAALEGFRQVRWWVDCGDDDFLYMDSSSIHIIFRQKEIKHEYRVRDGAHTWDYWRTGLPMVLEFVSESFRK